MQSTGAPQPLDNVTVHASAGSGKTYLLVSRIIRLLLDGARPGSILAITFTRKAAAEMQQRLLQRLFELAALDDAELNAHLALLEVPATTENRQQARCLYELLLRTEQPVKLTTFHAFCQDLLRRFPLEADIPAGFELQERTTALQDEAFDALLEEAATDEQSATTGALDYLLREFSLFNTRKALHSFLQQRSDWWAWTAGADNPTAYAIDNLAGQLQIDPTVEPMTAFLAERSDIARFIPFLEQHDTKTNLEFAAKLHEGLANIDKPETAYQLIRQAFLTDKGEPRARKITKTNSKIYGEDGAVTFLALHEHICARLADTDGQLAAIRTYQSNRAWYTAGSRLLAHYQRIKREQRLLDFNDLEWKSCQLLTQGDNALWVQYKLDSRIDHLLIDEFQDTNPTQWQLVLPILQEMAANTMERNRSVFLVGDAKQSIYRFRRAEPRLFNTAGRWLAENLNAKSRPLNKSWRSAPAIIQCVNRLFGAGPLHDQLPEFEPHETQHTDLWGEVKLLPLAGLGHVADDSIKAAVDSLNENQFTSLRDPLRSPRSIPQHKTHYEEGKTIAGVIHELLAGQTVIRAENNTYRTITYSDIILLLRSRTHVHEYELALREAGIPYLGADRGTLLEALEVIDMVNLLTWLITPFDNLALAGILRTPLFNLTDTDLLTLAAAGSGNWYERLACLAEASPDSDFARAHAMLARWQAQVGHIPVHDLLDRIYSEANVLARYHAAFPPALQSRVSANLTRFLELALEMDSGRYPSLTRFLHWLAELKQQAKDSPDEPPALGQQDRVRLMTIHEAKGLEASVIFLADAARSPSGNTAYETLVIWPAEEPRPSTFMLTRPRTELDPWSLDQLAIKQSQEACEETNLLYVAVTRAKQLLYISGSLPGRGDNTGWYGQIAARYALEADSWTDSQCLEVSGRPHPSTSASAPASPHTITVDPRLSQPMEVKPAWYEIAPSRSHEQLTTDFATDADGQTRGVAIHLMLEKLSQQPVDRDSVKQRIAQQLGFTVDEEPYTSWWREAVDLIANPTLKHLFNPADYQQAWSEVPISYLHHGQTIHGVIDRLVLVNNELWLIDYKTHQHSEEKTLSELAGHYQQQLAFYIEGIKKVRPDQTIRPALLFTWCARLWPVTL